MEDAIVKIVESGGKRAFIFKPYPPFCIFIGNEFWVFDCLDAIRDSKGFPEELKEAVLKGCGRSQYA